MKHYLKLAATALALCLPLGAEAHRAWMLPSATVLSGNDPWVTVDAAISNDLFYFEHHPLRLDGLAISAPDGSAVTAENASTGRYRSTFDVPLKQSGTYKLAIANSGLFASYKENGETKRWRGSPASFAKEVPTNAEGLQVTQAENRLEVFVTAGNPTGKVLAPTGKGLELAPVTHPNDLFAGEAADFRLLIDGKPAAGLKVSVIPGGNRYRNQLEEMTFTTDADGAFSVTWPAAGMYWLSASHSDDQASIKPAKQRRASYTATLEVLAP